MRRPSVRAAISAALLIALSAGLEATPQGATKAAPQAAKKAPPPVNASAAAIQEFLKRVDGYVTLHKKLEDTLPPLPKQTTPQQIDVHQRALAKLIQEARKDGKPGELLMPAMQQRIRNLLRPVFAGQEGLQIKNEILDNEYKGNVKLVINGRYPDEIPVSTMPPQVLKALPKLPEELEYRFILNNLILFDTHAHIIADYMERAFN
jgi:hypothetical protein